MRTFVGCGLALAIVLVPAWAVAGPPATGQMDRRVVAKPGRRPHHHHHGRNIDRVPPALHQPMTGRSSLPKSSAAESDPTADSGDVAIALSAALALGLVGGMRLRTTSRGRTPPDA